MQLSSAYLVYVFEVPDVKPDVNKPGALNRRHVENNFTQWVISPDTVVIIYIDAQVVIRWLRAHKRELLVPSRG